MEFIKKIVVYILTLESRIIIRKYKPFIVAVTGSVGKTSTKDAIYSVLKNQSKFVRKSKKSMNSDIGLPLTIIGVANAWYSAIGWWNNILAGLELIIKRKEYPDCLILEIGADHPNDIKKIMEWLHPDIGVITKISTMPVHVEFFESPEQVFEEKASLALGVKQGGTLIVSADYENMQAVVAKVKDRNLKIMSYGTKESATVRGLDYNIRYGQGTPEKKEIDSNTEPVGKKNPIGFSFNIKIDSNTELVTVHNILGQVYMYPLLAAVAVGNARGMTLEAMAKTMVNFDAPHGRMNIISGINNSVIIDDTYNSSPDATISALETLKNLECDGRKIAVLGDMMELGKYSAEEHRKIGNEAGKFLNQLVTVGQRSRITADEVSSKSMPRSAVHSFDTALEAADYMASIIQAGDYVLIKGSQSIRMEKTVKALMNEPNKAPLLLVRQEKEWLEKK